MTMRFTYLTPVLAMICAGGLFTGALLTSCGDHHHHSEKDGAATHDEHAEQKPSNRLSVNELVRRNLGITFAKVTYRPIAQTIRVPGQLSSLPGGVRDFHAPLAGKITWKVALHQNVTAQTVLYEIDAPAWRTLQQELSAQQLAVTQAEAHLSQILAERAQAERQLASLNNLFPLHKERAQTQNETITMWRERITQLEQVQAAGGGRASELIEARARLLSAMNERAASSEENAEHLMEHARLDAAINRQGDAPAYLTAQITAARTQLSSAQAALWLGLQHASSLTGYSGEALLEQVAVPLGQPLAPDSGMIPRWQSLDRLAIVAGQAGIISGLQVENGAWVEANRALARVVDPTAVRFVGSLLQKDLASVRAGQMVRIAGPQINQPELIGKLTLSPELNPASRTLEVSVIPDNNSPALIAWARPGMTTTADIITAGGDEALVIPVQAVVQDTLKKIIFRRDPQNPDEAIYVEADLGLSDGKYVVVESGLREGDEVVVDGAYELVLAIGASGKKMGGHFHADGTWHADSH
jgi:multidrug efflux pump subunit AcrA (membrane-fusion protein)